MSLPFQEKTNSPGCPGVSAIPRNVNFPRPDVNSQSQNRQGWSGREVARRTGLRPPGVEGKRVGAGARPLPSAGLTSMLACLIVCTRNTLWGVPCWQLMQFSATEAALEAGKWVGGISILGGSLRLLKFKGPDGSSAPLVQPPAGWLRRKSRHALVELSVGGIASSYPPSLPPSLLPIREAAAGALAPTAAPVAPPCCRPHHRLVPARGRALAFPAGGWRGWRCGEGVGGFGGLGLHPSFQ